MLRTQRGVTLMELMIVVVVVGILAAIAYPSYREQVRRSNRTEAKVALEQRAAALEKCFTRYMRYNTADPVTNNDCPAAADANVVGPGQLTEKGMYRLTLEIPRPGAPAGVPSFRLTATPQGAQATDAQCASFRLDDRGTREVTGSASASPATCW